MTRTRSTLNRVTKWCDKCEAILPIAEFYVNKARHDGLSGFCIIHQKAANKEYTNAKRRKTLDALGGKCVRCGFDDERALQIDHVGGGGAIERRTLGTMVVHKRVHTHPNEYQLLCANCNWIKRHENDETVGRRVYTRTVPESKG